jgi:hypothetical protein
MSLFYANPTPLLRALSDATTKFVSEACVLSCALLFLTQSAAQGNTAREHDGLLERHGQHLQSYD